MVGEWLYDGTSALLGDVGAHVIAVFVFLAGVLLLTGASIAGVIKATGDSVTTTGRRVRERAEPVRTAVSTRMRTAREELAELETSEFTAVKRRRDRPAGRAPGKEDFWSGAERFPDLYEGSAAVEPEPQMEPEPESEPSPRPSSRPSRPRATPRGSPRIPRPTSPA